MDATESKPLTKWPLCGSRRTRRERISLRLKDGRTIEEVPADACPMCGEQFLDLATASRLDALRVQRPK